MKLASSGQEVMVFAFNWRVMFLINKLCLINKLWAFHQEELIRSCYLAYYHWLVMLNTFGRTTPLIRSWAVSEWVSAMQKIKLQICDRGRGIGGREKRSCVVVRVIIDALGLCRSCDASKLSCDASALTLRARNV